jgi:hypothetical protein
MRRIRRKRLGTSDGDGDGDVNKEEVKKNR